MSKHKFQSAQQRAAMRNRGYTAMPGEERYVWRLQNSLNTKREVATTAIHLGNDTCGHALLTALPPLTRREARRAAHYTEAVLLL